MLTEELPEQGYIPVENIKGDVAGVYIVIEKDTGKAVYVGQSLQVKKRLKAHNYDNNKFAIFVKRIFKEQERYNEESKQQLKLGLAEPSCDISVLKEFEKYLKTFPLTNNTIKQYLWVLKKYLSEYSLSLNEDVNSENVNIFIKKYKRSYFKRAVKLFFKFKGLRLQLREEIEKIKEPVKKKRVVPTYDKLEWLLHEKILKGLDKIINEMVVRKIYGETVEQKGEFLKKDIFWILRLAHLTGARISEILSLKPPQISSKKEELDISKDIYPDWVPNTIAFGTITFIQKGAEFRGKEPRIVPISDSIFDELYNYIHNQRGVLDNQYCFLKEWGENRHSALVYLRWILEQLLKKKLITKEELEIIKQTHNFRRAIINKLLSETGGNITIPQDYIGHSTSETTRKYLSEWAKENAKRDAFIILTFKKNLKKEIGQEVG